MANKGMMTSFIVCIACDRRGFPRYSPVVPALPNHVIGRGHFMLHRFKDCFSKLTAFNAIQ